VESIREDSERRVTRAKEEGMQLLIATRPSEGGLTGQPYISVIVTAYNRRRYLSFALRSLEAQMLPRDKFEVIVVKNFEDKESDSIISRNGWKDVYEDSTYHGRKVLVGLEESKGDVITFLEDDDMYVNNRLEAIYKAFTSYDRLVYFHNSQAIIDENGNVLERPPPSLLISKNLVGGSPIVVDVDRLRGLAKRYNVSVADLVLKARAGADFNGSSIAVRRSALEVSAHLFRELPISVDSFTFASSLKAGGLMYFTDEKLTLYRVHGENWSLYGEDQFSRAHIARSGSNKMYLRRAKFLLSYIKAYKLIGSSLLNDDVNRYLCVEKLYKGSLLLLLPPELGVLPPELRLSLSDVKLALRCYKVRYEGLADVAFVMGNALLSPILASPKGRLVIDKLLEGVAKALATKRALKRESLKIK
jgi:glycosyltransferase involved in cell wall biosynthesis